jgi:hypothetical protein
MNDTVFIVRMGSDLMIYQKVRKTGVNRNNGGRRPGGGRPKRSQSRESRRD